MKILLLLLVWLMISDIHHMAIMVKRHYKKYLYVPSIIIKPLKVD